MRFIDDIRAVYTRDPAARNFLEILLCYPGIHAIWLHRIAHLLWLWKIPVLPRFISHLNRFLTGVEIHPGATIGADFFIDHGAGVVIGETTIIGRNVTLYSGVVLGGTSLEHKKRHPTLGNDVVVGANASILGDILVGDGARIGAGSVVVKPVPAGATIVGVPGRAVQPSHPHPKVDLQHGDLPDPVARCVECLMDHIEGLEGELRRLRTHVGLPDAEGATPSIRQQVAAATRGKENGSYPADLCRAAADRMGAALCHKEACVLNGICSHGLQAAPAPASGKSRTCSIQ